MVHSYQWHLTIRDRYLIVEVKTGKFEPADLGQLLGYKVMVKHSLNTPCCALCAFPLRARGSCQVVVGSLLVRPVAPCGGESDEEWRVRKEEIDRKRSEERAFMEGRRAAQKAWATAHPDTQS